MPTTILPRRLQPSSAVHMVHLSSPVPPRDRREFLAAVRKLRASYPKTKVAEVRRGKDVPSYLAASETERLAKFLDAAKRADWLCPIYGGTGCEDVVSRLTDEDFALLARRAPIVNGFSDTTYLLNDLYLRTGLVTFHFANGTGLFGNGTTSTFFAMLTGARTSVAYRERGARWITPPPKTPIEGIALGGNLTTFRDLLDVAAIEEESWRPYVLFLEDLDIDAEDFHRMIISLDARGLFEDVRAVVLGRMSPRSRLAATLGDRPDRWFTYLMGEVQQERKKQGDPLHVLHVPNFGHGVRRNVMALPIGGKVVLGVDGTVECVGPFVS